MKATEEKKMLNLGLKITMSKMNNLFHEVNRTMCKKGTLKLS